MADVENDDRMPVLVDLVQHSPVAREVRTEDALELFAQRLPHPTRVVEQGAGDELDRRRSDVRRQTVGDGPRRCRDGPEPVTLRYGSW